MVPAWYKRDVDEKEKAVFRGIFYEAFKGHSYHHKLKQFIKAYNFGVIWETWLSPTLLTGV